MVIMFVIFIVFFSIISNRAGGGAEEMSCPSKEPGKMNAQNHNKTTFKDGPD